MNVLEGWGGMWSKEQSIRFCVVIQITIQLQCAWIIQEFLKDFLFTIAICPSVH